MMHVPHNPNRPVRGPTAEERRLVMLEWKVKAMEKEREKDNKRGEAK